MKSTDQDDITSLALGAISPDEAAELAGRLTADSKLRQQFRHHLETAGMLGLLAQASSKAFSDERKQLLKQRILAASRDVNNIVLAQPNFASVIPNDKLVQFGPGVQWTVLPGQGMTTVYWIFDPPEPLEIPWEHHEQTQSGFVLQGNYTMLYPNAPAAEFRTGDFYSVPAGIVHGARFQTRTLLCDVYRPAKEDFELLYTEQLAAAYRDSE